MQIFIKLLNGETLTIETQLDSTIQTIKEIIEKKESIKVKYQRLIFSGRQLEDNKKLSDYKILPNSTLHLSARLRGD